MKDSLVKIMERGFKNYRVKQVNISGKPYDLYVFSEDEDLNLFEGFLFTEVTEKSELSHLISRYRAPVSGYVPRLSLLSYKNQLIIKDYRKSRLIRKTLQKINKSFISKLKKALTEPDESNFNKLFDRTDIIEEFWILYRKSRDYLLDNIKGISDEDERIAFVDNFMMQMLTLWYLQEKRFFDGDTSYFITKFTEMEQKKLSGGFKNYYEFLIRFFGIIRNNVGNQYYEDDSLGKVVVLGPAIFLNGNIDQAAITIPDRWFYKEGMTDTLINTLPNTLPKKVGADVPLFNLFESRDWTEGNIDDFVLGAIYEKLITHIERKKLGAYYTPEAITEYICKNTIEPYLIDKVNGETGGDFKSIDTIVESDDKEMLLRLFDSLKEIKILDPAVGSAHFLADAIEVLLGVYEKIWDRAKEIGLRRGLEITAADERGRLKNINLLEISDRDQFRIYIKFFIILSKNIYGVDIKQSAINVARARLFLSIAKHFDAGKGCFIRFPNVHFNLRRGNSLIGYVGLGVDGGVKQSTFAMFVGEKEAVYAAEPIRVVSELGGYLSETARTLGMDGDILNEIGGLNGILSMERIGWNEFERVLRVKEKLIRILIASLNSEHAMPLNDLIKNITALFDGKLDERFAREHEIDLDVLEEIGTFHWIMEFPEVFLERGGFDVVVGNPPYLRQETIGIEKAYFESLYPEVYEGTADYCVYFVENSINVLKESGYHSFIITNKWIRARYGKKLRKYLAENVSIKKLIDFNGVRVFKGATNDVMVYIIRRSREEIGTIQYSGDLSKFTRNIANNGSIEELINKNLIPVDQKSLNEEWNLVSRDTESIKRWIEKKGRKLKDWDVKIYRGITTGFNEAFIIDAVTRDELIEKDPKSEEIIKPVLRGKDIGRYCIGWGGEYLILARNGIDIPKEYPAIYEYLSRWKDKLETRWDQGDYWYNLRSCAYYEEFERMKIVWQRVTTDPIFIFDGQKFFILDSMAFLTVNSEYEGKYLCLLLNSKIIKFYLDIIGHLYSDKGYLLSNQYVERFPIPESQQKPYEILADYLLFLNQHILRDDKEKLNKIEMYFNNLADSLVYELYFHEKFHKDGLYPEPKEHLSELVSKHLKPISYNRWAELYWKKQLNGTLTPGGEKELEELETENTKTIESVHDAIANDEAIQKQIERIMGYEWVNVIVGGDSQ